MSADVPPRSPLAGIFPVLCTPFAAGNAGDAKGAIDFASLDRLVDFTLASGADGLTVGGVASEVHKLADDERRAIVERVLARVKGGPHRGAPVWVGSGHQCTELAIEHSLHAQRHGAAGVMVMPPHAHPAKPSLASLAAFFRDLDGAIALPIMIQDAPLVSGLQLPVGWLCDVAAKCPRVRAVKVEAPPTGPKMSELVARAKEQLAPGLESGLKSGLALFGGLGGANFVAELQRGASGTLPGAAFPELAVAILKRFRAGDLAAATQLHERALPLIRFVSQSVEFSYHAYKRILVKRGVLASAYVRRPTCAFDDGCAAELDALSAVYSAR